MTNRYDVVYYKTGPTIEPHFCREWDLDGGCFGSNPEHGLSLEEACDEVAEWYETKAKEWRERNHPTVERYRSQECEY